MNFEEYLLSKKIDSSAFKKAEPEQWESWSREFIHMHPNSFTAQKLYLINPIRRNYPLSSEMGAPAEKTSAPTPVPAVANPGKPVMKIKPKMG